MRQAVFLVGGRGSRLGALTETIPKPMLPVGGRPFLDYLVESAVRQGVTDIVLLCGYRAKAMEEHYPSNGPGGSRIHIVVEPEPAGTAGALIHAGDFLDSEFFLCNGDTFFDIDWNDLTSHHATQEKETQGEIAALALRKTAPGRRSGVVDLDPADGRIRGFYEPDENRCGPVNAGLYAVRRGILDWISEIPCSIEQQIFPRLAVNGRLKGKVYDGYFIDIGVPDDFARAQTEIPKMFSGKFSGTI